MKLRIKILPPWWSTRPFLAAFGILLFLIAWAAHRLRVNQVAREFEARLGERTRIARDLHDTLLQSFNGLLLRFQGAHNLLPGRAAEAKGILETALEEATQAITDARDAVEDLRGPSVNINDLANAIEALGRELAAYHIAENGEIAVFCVEVEGTPRDLHPILRDEIYRITAEALRNAFHHARARHIEVEIRYDARQIRVRVRDDGIGIDASALSQEGRSGHFGLRGMRERAKRIGGRLAVWSEPSLSKQGPGTELELTVPASAAEARNAGRHFRLFRSKVGQTHEE